MKPKVLFVLPNLEPGGAERLVTMLLQHLPREKLELHIALVARYGLLLDRIPDDVQVHHLRAGRVRRVAYPLLRLAWRLRPDVVLSTLGYMNLALIPLWPFLPGGTRLPVRRLVHTPPCIRHSPVRKRSIVPASICHVWGCGPMNTGWARR